MATLIPALSCQARKPRGCEAAKPSASCLQPAHLPCAGRPRGLSPTPPGRSPRSPPSPSEPEAAGRPPSPGCVSTDGEPVIARTWFLRYLGFPSCGMGHASCKKGPEGGSARGPGRSARGPGRSAANKTKTRKNSEALAT